ncbi:hypothetical protein SAMN04489761_0685 [Tenacibaculum sp. MAR_2009_124]|nr:hypothetical protein SAMN04489761_0685 [Tenacibaculum sp. MAR_2009_124]
MKLLNNILDLINAIFSTRKTVLIPIKVDKGNRGTF